jgi:disulfide bond formation protein DsbB
MIVAGISSEAVGLYYQYVLDYGPCPLCIHVRIGILAWMLVSLFSMLLNNLAAWRIGHLLNTVILVWLCERTYQLLGTERGFLLTECGMDSGLPSWLPLDQWIPAVFEPWESCGYTPKMLFDISMAEALIVIYPLMLLISLTLLVTSLISSPRHNSI